jgi:hypothetical protein
MTPNSRSIPVEYIHQCFEYREEVVNGVLQGNVYWKYRENVRKEWNTRFSGKKAGNIDFYGYCSTGIRYNNITCRIKLHVIVWILNHGCYPDNILDHIDNNRSNNIISNLRKANPHLNNLNVLPQPNKSSQYRGVYFNKVVSRWHTQYALNRKRNHVGHFDDEIEAALAYNEAISKVFNKEYAYINDISMGYTNQEYPNMPRHWEPEKVAA